jgi:hypothetical protein
VRQRAARRRQLEKIMRQTEETVARLEAEQHALLNDLEAADATRSYAEINQRLTELPARIADETQQWETAAAEWETLNNPT